MRPDNRRRVSDLPQISAGPEGGDSEFAPLRIDKDGIQRYIIERIGISTTSSQRQLQRHIALRAQDEVLRLRSQTNSGAEANDEESRSHGRLKDREIRSHGHEAIRCKSMNPLGISTEMRRTFTLSPTSAPCSPRTTLPSTGTLKRRT